MSKKSKNTEKEDIKAGNEQELQDEKVNNESPNTEADKAEEKEAETATAEADGQDEQTAEENAPEAEVDETAAKMEALENSAKEWQDKYMRLSAEFDNYRRRTLKEKAELTKTAGEDILLELLSVIDDFERAQASMNESTDINAVKEGVELIYNKFTSFVKQKGINEIEAKEKDFDVDHHEAITKIPAPDKKLKGKVVDVIQKGYMLHDKVVRFAKVVIGE